MALLPEQATWEPGITQLEETDVVQGGANGIDNLQPKQLANRTVYLKQQIEALGTDKQPVDALLTALADLVTAADKLPYFTGPDAVAMTTLTAFMRTVLSAADATAARATLGAATQADINAAVAALVASSHASLDTLKELATALGNDPNFATTITNALAGKQAADQTLTALAGVVTAADKLIYASGADVFSTTTLTAFMRALLAAADAAAARTTLGAATQADINASVSAMGVGFSYSWWPNGYIKFPSWLGGWIVQWGFLSDSWWVANTTRWISFPVTFPNGVFRVFASSENANYPTLAYVSTQPALNASGHGACMSSGGAQTYNYIAIGR